MDRMMNQYLGEAARMARQRLELTQAQVALRIGLATEVYGRIERGNMTPSLPALMRMCRVLGLDTNALLGFSSASPPPWFHPAPEPPRRRSALEELLRQAARLTRPQIQALTSLARCLSATSRSDPRKRPRAGAHPSA